MGAFFFDTVLDGTILFFTQLFSFFLLTLFNKKPRALLKNSEKRERVSLEVGRVFAVFPQPGDSPPGAKQLSGHR
jgi:hypothetical protein